MTFTSIFHEACISINEKESDNMLVTIFGGDEPQNEYEMYADRKWVENAIKTSKAVYRTDKAMAKYCYMTSNSISKMIVKAKAMREKAPDDLSKQNLFKTGMRGGLYGSTIALYEKKDWDKIIKGLESNKKFVDSEAKRFEKGIKESFLPEIELI